jgi:hypothetical protein
MNGLTNAYLVSKTELLPILLQKEKLVCNNNSEYYLLIYSTTTKFTKILVYPVNSPPVIKYLIGGSNITESTINEILDVLKPIQPIILHTSGIVFTKEQYEYEIYFTSSKVTNIAHFKEKISQIRSIEFVGDSVIA